MPLQNAFADLALEETAKKIQRGTPDQDQRFEFSLVGDESKPLYIGQAEPGTLTNASTWVIQKYTWVVAPSGSGNVPSLIQTRVGSWDSRSGLF